MAAAAAMAAVAEAATGHQPKVEGWR